MMFVTEDLCVCVCVHFTAHMLFNTQFLSVLAAVFGLAFLQRKQNML